MSLYVIGDLHLHFGSELKIGHPQIKDQAWKNHEEKLRKNCADDTLVLVGDHSWGKNLAACEADMQYIIDLPGRKILIRGNHDMFWDAKKTDALNERYAGKLAFLQNNYYAYRDYALVGTKGFVFEGPFYLDRRGRIVGWDEKNEEHAKKIVARELDRLRVSFEAARADGYHTSWSSPAIRTAIRTPCDTRMRLGRGKGEEIDRRLGGAGHRDATLIN